MKLKYRDFVGDHVKDAINRIIAIRPAPLVDVSHSLVINIRRINAKINDFVEARKVISGSHEEKVLQYKVVLFFVPEGAGVESVMGIASDKARLRKVLANQKEREDGSEILELDWLPKEEIDFESMNVPTAPFCIDGVWNFVVLQRSAERGWVFRKDSEQFQLDMDELWDTEVDIEIRVITNEMIEKSQEKRPGFIIPTDDMLTAWFMFEVD